MKNRKLSLLLLPNLIWNDGIAFGLFSFNEKIYYDFLTGLIMYNHNYFLDDNKIKRT